MLGWPASEPLRSTCVCLANTRIIGPCQHTQSFIKCGICGLNSISYAWKASSTWLKEPFADQGLENNSCFLFHLLVPTTFTRLTFETLTPVAQTHQLFPSAHHTLLVFPVGILKNPHLHCLSFLSGSFHPFESKMSPFNCTAPEHLGCLPKSCHCHEPEYVLTYCFFWVVIALLWTEHCEIRKAFTSYYMQSSKKDHAPTLSLSCPVCIKRNQLQANFRCASDALWPPPMADSGAALWKQGFILELMTKQHTPFMWLA